MVLLGTWAQSLVTCSRSGRRRHRVGQRHLQAARVPRHDPVRAVPFTRLVHIVSAPVWYPGRRYQIVRQKGVKPAMPRPQRPRTYEAPVRNCRAVRRACHGKEQEPGMTLAG